MDSLVTDDKFTIVNRSVEHRISKKLICKIPHFERMLSHECLESNENKVKLDFDEHALQVFLNWIEFGFICLKMDFVIHLYNIMNYFCIRDHLVQNCADYFSENFCSEHLAVVLPQVTSTSALINSDTLDAFICRYFLNIANSNVWLNYPVATIEKICALDVMIHSEYQVFDAIIKWIDFKADSRKRYLEELLQLVRCCNLEDDDTSKMQKNELFKTSISDPDKFHDKSNCKCSVDRTKQGNFIMIEKTGDNKLRARVLDLNFIPIINQVLQADESLASNLFHGKYVSDIPFDSGRQMMRIDWKQKKYRLFDLNTMMPYYLQFRKFFYEDTDGFVYDSAHVPQEIRQKDAEHIAYALLEATGKHILVTKFQNKDTLFFAKHPKFDQLSKTAYTRPTYCATVIDNNVYVLTSDLEFLQFNIDRNLEFKNIGLQRFANKLNFDNLLLTCKQAGDGEVILMDKSTKDVFCFNVSTQRWKSICRIIDCKSKSDSNVLETFTFGFVSTDSINLCLEHKFTQ